MQNIKKINILIIKKYFDISKLQLLKRFINYNLVIKINSFVNIYYN